MEGGLVHPPSTSSLLPGIDGEGFSSVAQTSANQMINYGGQTLTLTYPSTPTSQWRRFSSILVGESDGHINGGRLTSKFSNLNFLEGDKDNLC